MHSYLVEYEGKIIGCYKKFYDAESFILSCLQNNFIKDSALIHTYRTNSCFKIETTNVNLKSYSKSNFLFNGKTTFSNSTDSVNILSNSKTNSSSSSELLYESSSKIMSSTDTETPVKVLCEPVKKPVDIDYSNPAVIEMAKQKVDLQHKINLLKKQKEKIEESKNVYENDLKLFKMFKQSKETNPSFEIPELFAQKYNIMINLENSNELTWENFSKNYKQENYYGDYFSSNSYENMFINNSNNSNNSSTCSSCTDTIEEEFNIKTESD